MARTWANYKQWLAQCCRCHCCSLLLVHCCCQNTQWTGLQRLALTSTMKKLIERSHLLEFEFESLDCVCLSDVCDLVCVRVLLSVLAGSRIRAQAHTWDLRSNRIHSDLNLIGSDPICNLPTERTEWTHSSWAPKRKQSVRLRLMRSKVNSEQLRANWVRTQFEFVGRSLCTRAKSIDHFDTFITQPVNYNLIQWQQATATRKSKSKGSESQRKLIQLGNTQADKLLLLTEAFVSTAAAAAATTLLQTQFVSVVVVVAIGSGNNLWELASGIGRTRAKVRARKQERDCVASLLSSCRSRSRSRSRSDCNCDYDYD